MVPHRKTIRSSVDYFPDFTELPFFASRIKLGKDGVESSDMQGLTEYEAKALEALKPELKSSIEKGVAFAQKQATPASV
ncbi:malate dehydrogenase [Ranunculus cassubicifolius]